MNIFQIINSSDRRTLARSRSVSVRPLTFNLRGSYIVLTFRATSTHTHVVTLQFPVSNNKVSLDPIYYCSCPGFTFWYNYLSSKNKLSINKETRPPTRNLYYYKRNSLVCKHILATLNYFLKSYQLPSPYEFD